MRVRSPSKIETMLEIRFHGRGGQGAVIASELLAQAAFLDGKWPQSFPFFGVERRGAPVTAYARVAAEPIRVRTEITEPDVVVVLDPGLLAATPVTDGLKSGGLLLVNTRRPVEALVAPSGVRRAAVDATRIALGHSLGSTTMPIVNTAMLGALARSVGVVSLEALSRAIDQFVPAQPEENRRAARDGYTTVRAVDTGPTTGGLNPTPMRTAPSIPEGPLATFPSELNRTAAWRTFTPKIHLERCTKCNFCWKFCPDDAIELDARGFPVIRLPYCKGCGICAEECPPGTIEMVAEA